MNANEIKLLNSARDFHKKNPEAFIDAFLKKNNIFELIGPNDIIHAIKKVMRVFDVNDINIVLSFYISSGIEIPPAHYDVLF